MSDDYSNNLHWEKENRTTYHWLHRLILIHSVLIRNSARAVCGVTSLSESDDATEFSLNQVIEVRKILTNIN